VATSPARDLERVSPLASFSPPPRGLHSRREEKPAGRRRVDSRRGAVEAAAVAAFGDRPGGNRASDLRVARRRVHSPHVTMKMASAMPREETRTETELALEGTWRVVVLNDPVNLMSYVVLVFKKVFGFDEQTARKKMLEVHEQGRSIVWSGLREKAEAYVFTLQQWHLTAVLEPDETH
jgi:ATP-dependent Clp protease adaptor protein ClpS